MSLLLRKECQPILDNLGLQDYHVDVDNKTVVLNCECGQRFITLPGVTVSRTNPSKTEITFAATLVEQFLTNNIKNINKYQKAITAFEKKDKPTTALIISYTTPNNYNSYTSRWHANYNVNNINIYFTLTQQKNSKITLSPKISVDSRDVLSVKDLNSFKFDKAEFDNHVATATKVAEYQIEKNTLDAMKGQMSSCEVK